MEEKISSPPKNLIITELPILHLSSLHSSSYYNWSLSVPLSLSIANGYEPDALLYTTTAHSLIFFLISLSFVVEPFVILSWLTHFQEEEDAIRSTDCSWAVVILPPTTLWFRPFPTSLLPNYAMPSNPARVNAPLWMLEPIPLKSSSMASSRLHLTALPNTIRRNSSPH